MSIAVSVSATSQAVEVRDARLIASDGLSFSAAILVEAGGTANVLMTQLIDQEGLWDVSAGAGTYHCMGAYDGAYTPLDGDCGREV